MGTSDIYREQRCFNLVDYIGKGKATPTQNPEWGPLAEYSLAEDGYKYLSMINIEGPVGVESGGALDVLNFINEAIFKRFDNDGNQEIYNTLGKEWVKG